MQFLELINKCLLELNYRQVNAFDELVKNDHKRIKTILNLINREICSIEQWNFLLRKTSITVPANTTEITNPINGRILFLIIDGQKYTYCQNIENFVDAQPKSNTYACLNDKLLLPKFDEEKTADIIYYTSNSVVDSNGIEKENFENATDSSIIPMPFVEQILVYGTCLRLKANSEYFKFPYWMSMYKEALANLKSKTSVSVSNAPVIKLFRQ